MSRNDVVNDKERMEKETAVERGRTESVAENSQVPAGEESRVSGKPNTGTACNSRYVRVRKLPSGSAQVVTIMNSGDKAEILDRIPGFYKVRVINGGHVGFVSSNYFTED